MTRRSLAALLFCLTVGSGHAAVPIPEMSASTVYVLVPVTVDIPLVNKRITLKGSGSGFLVGDGRHVVTNYHVCCQPEKSIPFQDKQIPVNEIDRSVEVDLDGSTKIPAKVLWNSPAKDLAVLELARDSGRKPVTLVPADYVTEGEKVYAIGFPGDAGRVRDQETKFRPTITDGIISAKIQPNERYGVGNGAKMYQTNAPINPGNSGGPLFDSCGRVLGINDATVTSAQGIHFAIEASEILAQLNSMNIPVTVAKGACKPDEGGPSSLSIVLQSATAMVAIAALALVATKRGRAAVRATTNRLHATRPPQPQFPDQQARGTAPVLRGLTGYHAGAKIRLEGLELAIGRDPRICHLVYPPEMDKISKRHCVLKYDPARRRVLLEDAWSRNGTFLISGQRVDSGKPTELPVKAQFYLSDRENVFEVAEES